MTTLFDTLEYTKGAEAIGIKREHAEYQAKAMAKLIDEMLVTKRDLKEVKNEIIMKLGSLMIAGMGLLGFILKST